MAQGQATAAAGTERAAWSHVEEMRSARRVQSRLLPSLTPRIAGLECAGLSVPARGVGGDFFDFVEAGPGRVALVFGDVSGKGVPAALMMATLQASLRSHYALATGELARRLESVNRFFVEWTASEHFASLFVGEYDEESGRLRYANCGHVPPYVLRRGLGIERLEATATVLGLFEDWSCVTAETRLSEGDLLLLVSDGVTEAADASGAAYGERRLAAALAAHREMRSGALARAVADEAGAFAEGGPADDLTVVAVRVRGRTAGGGERPGGRGPR